MKKWVVLVMLVLFCTAAVAMAAGNNTASPAGPAPSSGDGVSDGSGDLPGNDPNPEANDDTGNGGAGAAPNAGDGVPDGSGMDSPNGPNGG